MRFLPASTSPAPLSGQTGAAEASARRCAGPLHRMRNSRLLAKLLRAGFVQASALSGRPPPPSVYLLGGGLDAIFINPDRDTCADERIDRYLSALAYRCWDIADYSYRIHAGMKIQRELKAKAGAA